MNLCSIPFMRSVSPHLGEETDRLGCAALAEDLSGGPLSAIWNCSLAVSRWSAHAPFRHPRDAESTNLRGAKATAGLSRPYRRQTLSTMSVLR